MFPPRVIRRDRAGSPSPLVESAAREAFVYLAATDPLPDVAADAVIGFGTFDLALAVFCGELYHRRRARRILLTGGFGAGTADLGRPEADAWRDALLQAYPRTPAADVVVENRSTNTADNIRFTAALLAREAPALAFGRGIRRVLIVASPSRLRRARLTLELLVPALAITRCRPAADFERERAIHDARKIPFLPHLTGELDRLATYPDRGWIVPEPLPPRIVAAHAVLRHATGHSSVHPIGVGTAH